MRYFRRVFTLLVLLAGLQLGFGKSANIAKGDASTTHSTDQRTTNSLKSVSDSEAADLEIAALAKAFTNEVELRLQQANRAESIAPSRSVLLVVTILFIVLVFLFFLHRHSRALEFVFGRKDSQKAATLVAEVMSEEQALSEFQASFRVNQPAANPHQNPAPPPAISTPNAETKPAPPPRKKSPLEQELDEAWRSLRVARSAFIELNNNPAEATRQAMLENFCVQMGSVKMIARPPELLPAWQMASAMEGLLKHLKGKPDSVNASNLRTLGAALDLLELLCVPGIKPDLSTNPPVNLLAVDDDPLCLHAVGFALKRAFDPPELAPNGEKALELCANKPFDAIFLDVQLPGMNGFQLCAKIQETMLNRNTPIVFVTCMNDFDDSAREILANRAELIAKPFVIFEITLKALTLVLRRRLGRGLPKVSATIRSTAVAGTALKAAASELVASAK